MTADSDSFAFRPHENISNGYVRVLREISSRARVRGKSSRIPEVEAIHDVRVFIKRLRAMLWFARPALPAAVEKEARERLTTSARLLAGERDLAVARITLERLGRKTEHPGKRVAVARATRCCSQDAGEAGKNTLRNQLKKSSDLLRQTIKDIITNASEDLRWLSPSKRLKKAIQTTHEAGKKAQRTKDDTDFHVWRKKAKRLLYIAELTTDPGHSVAQKQLNKLQTLLGNDHDCVMAAKRLQTAPLPRSDRLHVVKLLRQREARLRKKARKIAHRMGL